MHDASWLVTDRKAGASRGAFASNNLAVHVGDDPRAVAANRAELTTRMGLQHVVFAAAAHGAEVARVDSAGADVQGVDALISRTPGIGIAAQGADCVMLAVASPDGWSAAVHCGWKGLVAGVVPATLDALADAGCDLTGAEAHLGPSICAQCYAVPLERAAAVAAVVPEAVVRDEARVLLDVRAGVLAQLRTGGVPATWDRRCTVEDPDLYSYRRDGVTGRQALIIGRRLS